MRRSEEPGCQVFISPVLADGRCELLAGNTRELQQPFIHRAGVDVLSFRAGQNGTALVHHTCQMHVACELDAHASWKTGSEIHPA